MLNEKLKEVHSLIEELRMKEEVIEEKKSQIISQGTMASSQINGLKKGN